MTIPTKEVQGKLWSTAPAHWAKYQEPSFIPVYQYVLQQVPLTEENRLLDAGCGSGLFLSMASATGAQLHGIDASPGLLSIAKGRTPAAALLQENLEALPFIDGTFDVVTGFNSFSYAGSFENALTEARRVVKRHGIVVIGVMENETEECPSTIIQKAVVSLAPLTPESTAMGNRNMEDSIENSCKAVGLKIRTRHKVSCPLFFSNEAELLHGFLCTALCARVAESVGLEAITNVILQQAQPYNLADDLYYLNDYCTILITEKI